MRGISWLAAGQSAAQEGLCTMEYVSKSVSFFNTKTSARLAERKLTLGSERFNPKTSRGPVGQPLHMPSKKRDESRFGLYRCKLLRGKKSTSTYTRTVGEVRSLWVWCICLLQKCLLATVWNMVQNEKGNVRTVISTFFKYVIINFSKMVLCSFVKNRQCEFTKRFHDDCVPPPHDSGPHCTWNTVLVTGK